MISFRAGQVTDIAKADTLRGAALVIGATTTRTTKAYNRSAVALWTRL